MLYKCDIPQGMLRTSRSNAKLSQSVPFYGGALTKSACDVSMGFALQPYEA